MENDASSNTAISLLKLSLSNTESMFNLSTQSKTSIRGGFVYPHGLFVKPIGHLLAVDPPLNPYYCLN